MDSITGVYSKLSEYACGSKFLMLKWLMINQWSHPTLESVMRGEDVDEERGTVLPVISNALKVMF